MTRPQGGLRRTTPWSPTNRARVRQAALESLPDRMAAAHCRQLTGAEFAARKAELEQREREERERREAP